MNGSDSTFPAFPKKGEGATSDPPGNPEGTVLPWLMAMPEPSGAMMRGESEAVELIRWCSPRRRSPITKLNFARGPRVKNPACAVCQVAHLALKQRALGPPETLPETRCSSAPASSRQARY